MTLEFTFVLLVKITSCDSVQLLDARCFVICGLLAFVVFTIFLHAMLSFSYVRYRDFTGIPRDTKKRKMT